MNILDVLKQLRDDLKTWVTNNLNALNTKINNIPRFSGDYNDLTNAPNITEDDSGNLTITDESGNIIFKADAEGIHTTALSLNGESAATEAYVDEAVASIPEVDLTGYATEDFVTQSIENAKVDLSESIISESEDWKIVDENGNIIFGVDANGAHTTDLTLNGKTAATQEYVNEAVEAIDLSKFYNKTETNEKFKELKKEIGEFIESESETWNVVDQNGNIIFTIDNNGIHTTSILSNGEIVATQADIDKAIDTTRLISTSDIDKICGISDDNINGPN